MKTLLFTLGLLFTTLGHSASEKVISCWEKDHSKSIRFQLYLEGDHIADATLMHNYNWAYMSCQHHPAYVELTTGSTVNCIGYWSHVFQQGQKPFVEIKLTKRHSEIVATFQDDYQPDESEQSTTRELVCKEGF